jgi:hypothetical protein
MISLFGFSIYYSTGGIENINGGTTSSGFIDVVAPPVTFTLFHFVKLVVPLLLSSKHDNLAVSSFVPSVIRL